MDEWSQRSWWSGLERKRAVKRNDYDCKCSAEPLVVNAWQSFLIFFSLYLLLSPCFVWATCVLCILSFRINWKKRFTRNLPRITFLNMFDKEPEQLKATVCWHDYDDFFCRSRRQWHLFSLLSFYIQRPGTSIWMISGCRYIVGCFPQWGKIHQLKTMKMVL